MDTSLLPLPKKLRRRLLAWYDTHRRDLPWRGDGCTPYRVLVSEIMLQQTQVATVVPYFNRFVKALPTIEALACADDQAVLRLWQGLGYYSRARNLHKAAKIIVDRHGGQLPRNLEELRALPGIGRYTAGAIASIAFGQRAAVVDGNVARVLCRLNLVRADPRSPAVRRRLWTLAESLLPDHRCGDFNSALMELGATICTPRSPNCAACPLRRNCRAFAAAIQEKVPRAAVGKTTPMIHRQVFVIRDARGRFLIEQRPPTGRWAGMWQLITRPRGSPPPLPAREPRLVGEIRHALTHRRYHFRVFACRVATHACSSGRPRGRGPSHAPRAGFDEEARRGRWATAREIDELPMPRPQLLALEMIQKRAATQPAGA